MTASDKKTDRSESSPPAQKSHQNPAPEKLGKHRPDHMTEDGRSLEAGSGNSLGDGTTAGGANRIAERRKLQE